MRLLSIAALLFTLALAVPARAELNVPILLYHRLGPKVVDSMTMTSQVFESHLKYLKDNGFTVIPLRRLIAFKQGTDLTPLPAKPVVIVEDDAHKSVYSAMLPLARKYNVPVTLFVYPSAISRASYALTWEQLRELKTTGLFDIESHTYWHPDFRQERKRLSPAEFDKFTANQLRHSKLRLEQELGGTVELLAWPFGIHDDDLIGRAAAVGYVATFTIEPHPVGNSDPLLKLPRFLLGDKDRDARFAAIVKHASGN